MQLEISQGGVFTSWKLANTGPSLLRAYCYVFISIRLVVEEADRLGYKVGEDFAEPGKPHEEI